MGTDKPTFGYDLDLVREILLWAERGGGSDTAPEAEQPRRAYHAKLMKEAGLIDAKIYESNSTSQPGRYLPLEITLLQPLTMKGQKFLSELRKDTIWNKAKEKAKEMSLMDLVSLILLLAKCVG